MTDEEREKLRHMAAELHKQGLEMEELKRVVAKLEQVVFMWTEGRGRW